MMPKRLPFLAPSRRGRTNPRSSKSRLVVAAVSVAVVVWVGGIVLASQVGGGPDPEQAAAQEEAARHGMLADNPCGPEVVCVTDEYDWDITEERFLSFYSENVFAGRVVEKVGTEAAWTSIPDDDETPHTVYSVEVGEVVKATGDGAVSPGSLVEVDLLGGPGKKTGRAHVAAPISCHAQMVGGQLAVGGEYLFSTSLDDDGGRQEIVAPPAGHVRLRTPDERDARVSAYREAFERQVDPFSAGVEPCPKDGDSGLDAS